jgi:hypothetical protein
LSQQRKTNIVPSKQYEDAMARLKAVLEAPVPGPTTHDEVAALARERANSEKPLDIERKFVEAVEVPREP